MKARHFFLTTIMACIATGGFGQTWNIGYPNEAEVRLTDNLLNY